MDLPQQEPTYWDNSRRPVSFLLMLASVAAVLGFIGKEPGILALGLGVAAYSWLTNPRRYLIFPEYLVIMFGSPRKRIIPFNQVSHVEFLSLPTLGDRVRLRLSNGRGVMLQAKDAETFHDRLEEALNNFHGPSQDYALDGGDSGIEDQP